MSAVLPVMQICRHENAIYQIPTSQLLTGVLLKLVYSLLLKSQFALVGRPAAGSPH